MLSQACGNANEDDERQGIGRLYAVVPRLGTKKQRILGKKRFFLVYKAGTVIGKTSSTKASILASTFHDFVQLS